MNQLNSRYEVIVSNKAAQMMKEHVSFLAQVNVEAALALTEVFREALLSLKDFPQRCPFLSSEYLPKNKYRKLIVQRRYIFFYQIVEQTVFVDYLVDCRQDYEWLLR